jgi:hypothetical protein
MNLKQLIAIVSLLLFLACSDEVEDITYPRLFTYADIVYDLYKTYEVKETTMDMIPTLAVADTIEQIVEEDLIEGYIDQITINLLSADEIEMYLPGANPPNLSFSYRLDDDGSVIIEEATFTDTIPAQQVELFPMKVNEEITELSIPTEIYTYRYYDEFRGRRRWAPIVFHIHAWGNEALHLYDETELLDYLREEEQLIPSDTLILWRGNLIYDIY